VRTLFITPFYYPELKFGGPPRKIHALSRGLLGKGHEVSVVTFHSEHPRWNERKEIDEVPVQYIPWFGNVNRQIPTSFLQIREAVSNSDLVHIYGLYNLIGPVGSWYAKHLRRPVIIEPQGMYSPRGRNLFAKRLYHLLFTNSLFKQAVAVMAASELERAELCGVVPKDRLFIRRNGTDVEEFRNLPSGDQFRNQFQIKEGERVVLFLGRISPIKNIEQLIRAFAAINLPDTRLILAGPLSESTHVSHLHKVISKLGFENRILLTGPIYDQLKLSAFAAASLFVLPSVAESFGNSAAEAVAAGVPVLLTETCGIAPKINGKAGLAVPLGIESLANGLGIMLGPNSGSFVSRRQEVSERLTWEEPIEQTINLYSDIIRSI